MKKNLAAFTIVRDDTVNLRRWLRHYAAQGVAGLYVLNHGSSGDLKTQIIKLCAEFRASLVDVYNPQVYDGSWLTNLAVHFHIHLLDSFDRVVFSGVDELVVATQCRLLADLPNPQLSSTIILCSQGIEIVDKVVAETDFDYPCYACSRYSKPALSSGSIHWKPGFHKAFNVPLDPPRPLMLLHLHKYRYSDVMAKHMRLSTENWHEGTWKNPNPPLYRHNRLTLPDTVRLWMKSHADDTRQFASFRPLGDDLVDIVRYACADDPGSGGDLCDKVPTTDTGDRSLVQVWV